MLYKRPGRIRNLVPDYLDGLLFDDIPYLSSSKERPFAQVLREEGVKSTLP